MRYVVMVLAVLIGACNTFYDPTSAPLQTQTSGQTGHPDTGNGGLDSGLDASSDASASTTPDAGSDMSALDMNNSDMCVSPTDDALCASSAAECGTLLTLDPCTGARNVDCGQCPPNWVCGLTTPNVCGCNCMAGGACLPVGAHDPNDPCQVCGDQGWSVATGDRCDDGDACTVTDVCQPDGTCAGAPRDCSPDECATAGMCDPTTGMCVYTAGTADNDPCTDDGLSCTNDVCLAGRCNHRRSSFSCVIDNACENDGDLNPNNDCQACSVMTDPYHWTNLTDGTSCSNNTGMCQAGTCVTN